MKNFVSIGLDFEKADTNIRGKYTFFEHQVDAFTKELQKHKLGNAFCVSTCNRTVIFAVTENVNKLIQVFIAQTGGNIAEFLEHSTIRREHEAVHHFFRISAGLESQILGDFEIIGQIKNWFQKFKSAGATDTNLEKLVTTTSTISKQIKTETGLSDGSASVSFAAVKYILDNSTDLETKKITLLGLGKIGRNTCENLVKHTGSNDITVINRSLEKSETLSKKLSVRVAAYEKLEQELKTTDILIVATGAKKPVITQTQLPENKSMLILDLSIPNNVDTAVKNIDGMTLVNVDELSKVVDQTLQKRRKHIPKAERIIYFNELELEDWLEKRKQAELIDKFNQNLNSLGKVVQKDLKKKKTDSTENFSEAFVKKLTGRLASHLRENPEEAEKSIELIGKIFKLD